MLSRVGANFRTFEPPPGFSEKVEFSEGQLFIEDLNNNNNELWLFQASKEFDISALKNKKVPMHGETIFQNEGCLMSGKSHKMSVFASSESELPDYQLLLPSRSSSGLFLASLPFAGQVNLTEYVSKPSPMFLLFSPEKGKEDIAGLRQRYFPFGSGKPLIKHKPIVESNTSNRNKSNERPVSAKKKVTFKMPLTETQEQNILEKANSVNQKVSVFSEAAISNTASKQKMSNKRDAFQENESPNKTKCKKKKHSPFPKDSESSSSPFKGKKVVPDMILQSEIENPTRHREDLHSREGKSINEISYNDELPYNGGQQDDSTLQRKSKKRKAVKSLINVYEENEITTSENKVLSYRYPHSDMKSEKHMQESGPAGISGNPQCGLHSQVTDHSNWTDQEVSHVILQSDRRGGLVDSKSDSHSIEAQNFNKVSNSNEILHNDGLQQTSVKEKESKNKRKAEKLLVKDSEKNDITVSESKVPSSHTSAKYQQESNLAGTTENSYQCLYLQVTDYPNLSDQKPLLENDDPQWDNKYNAKNAKKKKKKSKECADLGGQNITELISKVQPSNMTSSIKAKEKILASEVQNGGCQDSKYLQMVEDKQSANKAKSKKKKSSYFPNESDETSNNPFKEEVVSSHVSVKHPLESSSLAGATENSQQGLNSQATVDALSHENNKKTNSSKHNSSSDGQKSHKRKHEDSFESDSYHDVKKYKKRKTFGFVCKNGPSETKDLINPFVTHSQKDNKPQNFEQILLSSDTKVAALVQRKSLESSSLHSDVKCEKPKTKYSEKYSGVSNRESKMHQQSTVKADDAHMSSDAQHNRSYQNPRHLLMLDNQLKASTVVNNTSIDSNEQSFSLTQQKTKRKKDASDSDSSRYDKKSKKRKVSHSFQKNEEILQKTVLNIKQEVFSDNDDKTFSKQNLPHHIYVKTKEIKPYPETKVKREIKPDPETKVKMEIKPDPDGRHLTINNVAELKNCENSEDHRNSFNSSKKYKKSKKHGKQ